jgi:hypothetical protein
VGATSLLTGHPSPSGAPSASKPASSSSRRMLLCVIVFIVALLSVMSLLIYSKA